MILTILGREVPDGDWRSVHGDSILAFLWRTRRGTMWTPSKLDELMETLIRMTHLEKQDIESICVDLTKAGLLDGMELTLIGEMIVGIASRIRDMTEES